MRFRRDDPIEGHVGALLASALIAFFGFHAAQQVRLNLQGRTVPAMLVRGRPGGRAGSCEYAYVVGGETRTLDGLCYWAPSPEVDYLPSDPGLARSHGQPNLPVDLGALAAGLALLGVSLRQLREQALDRAASRPAGRHLMSLDEGSEGSPKGG